jgi:uncharacterized protein (TIGR03083 family)
MDATTHIAAITREGQRLAEAGSAAGLDAMVPYCPGWDVRELLRHLSEIHLWAAAALTHHETRMEHMLDDLRAAWPNLAVFWPEDAELGDYYLATNANLVRVLDSSPVDLDTWTFLPAPSPLQMWARRQAHETAIHRYDAESASGDVTGFDTAFAADGIDEILMGFAPRSDELPLETAVRMAIAPDDVPDRWTVTMGPDGIDTVRSADDTDLTLSGTSSDLYLSLWNRGDDSAITTTGDLAVLDTWRNRHRARWPRTRDTDEERAKEMGLLG